MLVTMTLFCAEIIACLLRNSLYLLLLNFRTEELTEHVHSHVGSWQKTDNATHFLI